ncbi:hypothetical protein F5887DRAFT_973527 [Amanita rubescens]|nr:hypothetical protein F5887DRAFT_973527 [Amanita rubescens]
MALTLPVEELTRLQVIFKLSFPDDLLTFEMLSNLDAPNISTPTSLSGYKLHLRGSREGSGLCLRVWAHYDGGSQLQESTSDVSEGEHPESPSQHSIETSSVADTPLELENDINVSIGPPVGIYPKAMAEPVWYDLQEQDGPTQLPDAFGCTNPSVGFVGDEWLEVDASSGFLGSVDDVVHTVPHINAHFDKQVSCDYNGIPPSTPYTSFLSGSNPLCDGNPTDPSCPQFLGSHSRSQPRLLHMPVNLPVDSLSSPSSDEESHSATSPTSSPTIGPRPYRCLEPGCDRWFKRDYTRKVHMHTHRRRDRKPFCCNFPGCPERFSRKHDRLRHEVGRHGLESEWNCQPCHRFFSSRATMERHIFDKHGDIAITTKTQTRKPS